MTLVREVAEGSKVTLEELQRSNAQTGEYMDRTTLVACKIPTQYEKEDILSKQDQSF